MSNEELRKSIEIVDVKTRWVKSFYQEWPARLKLAPQVSFRAKNVSSKPLAYVNFSVTFVSKTDQKELGGDLRAAIRRKALGPGDTSQEITLTSNLSVEGKNKQDFETNPGWEPYQAKVFAQSRGSQPVLLGIYDVSRDIDFKADEPVGDRKPAVKK